MGKILLLGAIIIGLFLEPSVAYSSGGGSRSSSHGRSHSRSHVGTHHTPRSQHAKRAFKHGHPCPSTGRSSGACPGYVIDHVTPLKRGGPDAPANMQWQTLAEGKAKDKIE